MRSMNQPDAPQNLSIEPAAEHAADAAESAAKEGLGEETPARPRLDPTRYGDWELNGKCVDF